MDDQQPLPPPCPRPDQFIHVRSKKFPPAQALAAGEALLADQAKRRYQRHVEHKNQPLSRPNTVAALTRQDEAEFAALEVELGGRNQLAALLHAADVPERDNQLAAMLVDPANAGASLAQLCAWARVSMRRLLDFVKDGALVRGQVKALVAVGERLPAVAASLMEDAVPSDRTCPTCRGLRQLVDDPTVQNPSPAPRICKSCDGTGLVPYHPETELRKVALQIGKLLDKPGNTNNVFIGQKFGSGTVQPFSQVVGALDDLLDGPGRDRFGRRLVDGAVEGESTDGANGAEAEGRDDGTGDGVDPDRPPAA
jgi:hypothetical protein